MDTCGSKGADRCRGNERPFVVGLYVHPWTCVLFLSTCIEHTRTDALSQLCKKYRGPSDKLGKKEWNLIDQTCDVCIQYAVVLDVPENARWSTTMVVVQGIVAMVYHHPTALCRFAFIPTEVATDSSAHDEIARAGAQILRRRAQNYSEK